MAKFRDEGGRVVMRSTKKKDRRQAMTVAMAWESAAVKARAGELTQAASVKILNELMEGSTGDSLRVRSNEQAFQEFLASRMTLGRASSTYARYKPIIDGFVASLGKIRAKASVSSLTAAEIERWRDGEVGAGKSAPTVNLGVAVIRAALEVCKRRGEILANPADAVEAVAGHAEEREAFTTTDIVALLKKAVGDDSDWKTAILVGAWTGLRLGDATSLTWEQVHITDGYLTALPDKTDKPVAIALAPELKAHLEALASKEKTGAIMPKLFGRKTGGSGENAGLSNAFARLMIRAKVFGKQGRKKTGKGRQMTSKTFHSLRHTFTTLVATSGAGDAVTKSMTGHTSDEVFRRYIHLGVDAQRGALDRLGWHSAEPVGEVSKKALIELLPDNTSAVNPVASKNPRKPRGSNPRGAE
jgi:integrase